MEINGQHTLQGRRALVTGGSRGIGAAIVARLAQEGADVALTYVSDPDLAEQVAESARSHGGRAIAIQADCSDAVAVTAAVSRTVEGFGGASTYLVNNAGIALMAPLDTYTLENFDKMIDVNVRAVFVATQAAAQQMESGGRIINIGSCNAERMPFAGGADLRYDETALVGLVKGLAWDLGPRGITINNIRQVQSRTDTKVPAEPVLRRVEEAQGPLGRYGAAEEIAAMVAYLAGSNSGYITGASLAIDGGFTHDRRDEAAWLMPAILLDQVHEIRAALVGGGFERGAGFAGGVRVGAALEAAP